MRLCPLILRSAQEAIDMLEGQTGAMPPGHNGPYHDRETPVRNTGYWLISFVWAYRLTGDDRFVEAARRAANYLSSERARPMGFTFWHRKNPHKDTCNGLIGQAWTIEALAVTACPLEMPELAALAETVFLLHPYDTELGLWQSVAVDGTYLGLDPTFNHQLWFAAAGALLLPYESRKVASRVGSFLDHLEHNMNLYPNGLIYHPLRLKRHVARYFLRRARRFRNRKQLAHKSVGYHAFNLYALALLKERYPQHPFWNSRKFERVWHHANTTGFLKSLRGNEYGYPYNPVGFEMAFAQQVFGEDQKNKASAWVARQLEACYDFSEYMMSRNTQDPATLAARIYEATRLSDLDIEVSWKRTDPC